MTIPLLDGGTGHLPLGRHTASEHEIEAAFVEDSRFAHSNTRPEIWREYEDARDLLRMAVRIHAVWLGGSFTTDKLDPSDIDALFLISGRDYIRGSVEDRKLVDSFVPRPNAVGAWVRGHQFKRVDSFVLHWQALADPDPRGSQDAATYCATRGYWDDFWQRIRSGSKDKPPTWRDSPPARGYLEVTLDDFKR